MQLLKAACFFIQLVPSVLCFLAGKPMVVSWCPLGCPHLFTLGGMFIPVHVDHLT